MSGPNFTFFTSMLFTSIIVLSACSSESLVVTESREVIASAETIIPIVDSGTSTPEPTFIPENTPFSVSNSPQWPTQPITHVNADSIKELHRWGRGTAARVYQLLGSDRSLVQTPLGIYVYQSTEPYLIMEFPGVEYFVVSPDEKWLAGSMEMGEVNVWSLGDFSLIQSITHTFPDKTVKKVEEKEVYPIYVGGMAFSPDSSQIAIGYLDGSVELWRIGESEPYSVLRHDSFTLTDTDIYLLYNLQFSPDGETLVIFKLPGIRSSNRMTFWSIPSGELIAISWAGRFIGIAQFAFLPDDQTLVVFMRDSSRLEVGLWDIALGSEISKFGTELSEIYQSVISSNGGQIEIFGMHVDGTLQRQVNNLPDGILVEKEELEDFPHSENRKNFDEFLFTQGHYNNMWGSGDNLQTARLGIVDEHSFRVLGDDYWLTFPETTSEPLNLPSGVTNPYFDIQDQSVAWCDSKILNFQNINGNIKTLDISAIPSCDGIAISQEGRYVSVWRDGSLYIINSDTGQVNKLVLNGPEYANTDIDNASFSPDEEYLISVQSALVIWKLDPPQKIALGNARGATGNVIKMLVSNDNSFVVTLNVGDKIKSDRTSNLTIWRTEDAAELVRISPPIVDEVQPEFETIAMSPDDELLVTGDDFGGVRFWSVNTGDEVAFIDLESTPLDILFTPNGSGLIVLLSDGTIRLLGIPQL